MSQREGRCPFCSEPLDPSSPICPSCGRNIFQPPGDDLGPGHKIQPQPRSIALTPRNLVIGGVVLLLIAIAPIIAFLIFSRSGSNQPSSTQIVKTVIVHDQPTQVPTTGSTSVSTLVTPTAVVSLTPPPPGTILYSENGSDNWQGWALSSEWKVVSQGLLISTGSGSRPSAVAPYSLQGLSNFAVETVIVTPEGGTRFGITACGSTQGDWQGYVGGIEDDSYGPLATIDRTNDRLGGIRFDSGKTQHTYRLEIRGNTITLLIDNAPVVHVSDDRYLQCGPQLGLWDSGAVLHVSSFKVIAL